MSTVSEITTRLKAERKAKFEELQKLDEAINALMRLNGTEQAVAKPRRVRITAFKRTRGVKAYRYVHGSVSYYDVARGLIARLGRDVTTYEIYKELCKLVGKQLPKRLTLNRIYGSLYPKMIRTHPVEGTRMVSWNVKTAAQLQNVPDLVHVEAKDA